MASAAPSMQRRPTALGYALHVTSAGTQQGTYLAAGLGHRSQVSDVDPTPLFPFGHGLSYAPVDDDHDEGAHGVFDEQARVRGEQAFISRHWIGSALGLAAAATAAGVLVRRAV